MTVDRWNDLISRLEDDGKIESKITESLDPRPGTVERVIAKTPLGNVRLSWTSEPKKIEEKALYSKRGSSTVSIQAKYDETDIIHVFSVERYDDVRHDWVAIDAANFGF